MGGPGVTGKRKGYQSLRLSESFMCTDAIRSPEMLLSRSPQKSRNPENKFFKDECVCGVGVGGLGEGREEKLQWGCHIGEKNK